MLLALVLSMPAATAVLGGTGDDAEAARSKVSVRFGALGQHELVTSGRLQLRVRSSRSQRVRISTSLKGADGKGRILTPARSFRLDKGRARTLDLPFGPAGAARISRCAPRRIVVKAQTRLGSRPVTHTASAPLRLDPPACARFFGPNSVWNKPLAANAPLDPNSGAVTGELLNEVADSFSTPPHPTINTTAYSSPIYTVSRDEPRTRVAIDLPPGYSPQLEERFASVPVPPGARPAAGDDSHMVVWQPSTDTLWEFWRMRFEGGSWRAGWGGRLDHVSRGPGHWVTPVANLGATATSLPLAGGMITAEELRAGRIDHALAVAVPNVRKGAHALPAQRSDGVSTSPNAVPEGARFRLDPNLDVNALGLPPTTRAMALAAQRYGIIVRDQSSVVSFFAEDRVPFGPDPYPTLFGDTAPWDLLRSFPWDHLQLMKMDLVASPGGDRPGSLFCRLLTCR